MVSTAGDALARAREFQRQTVALQADESIAIEQGWVFRSPSLGQVWDLNKVLVSGPVRLPEAVELVDKHLADLPYRHLRVEHGPSGERMEQELRDAGWKIDREVTMVLRGGPDREVATDLVVEADPEETLRLAGQWMRESPDVAPEAHAAVLEYWRREWQARSNRRLGILGEDGALVAMASVYSDGAIAQVESVYTLEPQRGRGYARALVSRAVALAQEMGHELTFIVADEDDWPKQLYARLGFEPAGVAWMFHRDV